MRGAGLFAQKFWGHMQNILQAWIVLRTVKPVIFPICVCVCALVNVSVCCPFKMKIGLILFIGGVNYANYGILTSALVCTVLMLILYICIYWNDATIPHDYFTVFLFVPVNLLDNFVDNELYLGFRELFNTTHKDCVWRKIARDQKLCTKDVKIWLYSNGSEEKVSE